MTNPNECKLCGGLTDKELCPLCEKIEPPNEKIEPPKK